MHLKIYFDSKPLFLCDLVDAEIEPYVHHDDAVFIDELDSHTVKSMIHEMANEKVHAGVFLHPDLEKLKKAFFKKFTLIETGGGRIANERGEILLIFRSGKWDLPKGKLDDGETLEECAIREVREETGIQQVELIAPLTTTWHTYHEGTKFILKKSNWYTMKADSQQDLTPQQEEDIHELKWVDEKDFPEYYPNMFPSVIDVLKAGLTK